MINVIRRCLLVTSIMIIASCGVVGKNEGDKEVLLNSSGGGLTIDSAGVVPILGNNATTTQIFIHNNSNVRISNISYSVNGVDSIVLDNVSVGLCSSIASQGKCGLKFSTPVLSGEGNQGSGVIVARYMVNGVENSFSQVINYEQVELLEGVHISSGVNMSSYGYENSYATLYVYSGNGNSKIEELSLNKPAFKLIDNNLTGSELAPLQVQAVEVSAPSNIDSSMVANLLVRTDLNQVSTMSVAALPVNSGAVLVTGLLPNYDLNGQSSVLGNSYIVTNLGNESALLSNISSNSSGVVVVAGVDQCVAGMVLAVGASCSVYFNIISQTEVARMGGSGLITVSYSSVLSGGSLSLVNVVNWNNSQKGGLLSVVFNSPVTFVQKSGVYGVNESLNVTIKNIGAVGLNNISFNVRAITGRLNVESVSNNCSSLDVGNSCVVNIRVSDLLVENNKQLLLTVNAIAGSSSYTRSNYVVYNTITNKPLFVLQGSPVTYQIFGNGKESQTGVIIVSNNGATATSTGIITSSSFSQFESFFDVNLGSGKCQIGESLKVGESCSIGIRLKANNQVNIGGQSGVAVYRLQTTGVNMGESGFVDLNIGFNVLANSQSFKIINVSLVDSDSGDGKSDVSKFILGGEKKDSKLVITYQNDGTNTVMVLGGYESWTSGVFWRLESFIPKNVAPGESFSLLYTNVLGSINANYLSNTLVAPSENVMLPTIYFQDYTLATKPTQFVQRVLYNGSDYVYVEGKLGTLTNSVVVNVDLMFESYVVNTSFNPNTRNYTDSIGVNIFVDMIGNTLLGKTNNCGNNIETLTMTMFNCSLYTNNWSGSVGYLVAQSYILESDTIFNVYYNKPGYEIDTNRRAIVVNTVYSNVKLPRTLQYWSKQVGGISGTTWSTGITIDANDNTYVIGSTNVGISGQVLIGTYNNYFVAKYDRFGSLIWTRLLGSLGGDVLGKGISFFNNNVYIVGSTNGILGQSQEANNDFFITKYTESGLLVWVRQFGVESGTISANAIIVNSNGIYVTGYTNKGIEDYFIAKYSESGNLISMKQFGESIITYVPNKIIIDNTNNIYLVGDVNIKDSFQVLGRGYFIAKHDSSGNLLWKNNTIIPGGGIFGNSIAMGNSQNIYVTGYTNTDLVGSTLKGSYDYFIAKYNESNLIWNIQVGESGGVIACFDIKFGLNNNFYVGGYTNFALVGNNKKGINDYFIAKYNESNLIWNRQVGEAGGNQSSKALAIGSSGLYVAGYTDIGLSNESKKGNYDYFISKFAL